MYFPKEGFLGFVPTYMQYNLQLKRREQSQPALLDGLFAGFPTPPLVVVVDGVPTQQRRWGVGVSRHSPLIVVSAPSSCSSFPLFPRRFSPPCRFPSPPHRFPPPHCFPLLCVAPLTAARCRRRRLAPPPASSSSLRRYISISIPGTCVNHIINPHREFPTTQKKRPCLCAGAVWDHK